MTRGPSGRCTHLGGPLLGVTLLAITAPPAQATEPDAVITVHNGETVMEAIQAVLPKVTAFDLLTGVIVLEFEEGWSEEKPDLECVYVPAELDLTVRVEGRDDGDLTGVGPANVRLPGFVVKAEGGSVGGAVHLQDVDLTGFCVQPPDSDGTTSRARLVVNGDRKITLVDVTMAGEDDRTVVDRSYGLFATSGVITAYNLQGAGFSTGFAVKLTDASVQLTQTGGAYTTNTWGALGSFGANVSLIGVTFKDNQLQDRGLDLDPDWDNDGGSIYAEGGSLSLSGVSFWNDWAPQRGGAIALESVASFTGCGLTFAGSAAGAYGGAISAHHSRVTLDAGEAGACGPNVFYGVSAPLGAALSLSQNGDGEQIHATLSWLELSQISGESTISASLSGTLSLTDVSTPGGLGAAGLFHAEGDSNPKIGAITAARLDVRGDGAPLPDGSALISVENTSLTLTESTFCGLVSGDDAAPMISITDATGDSLLQRNTIWGGWSDVAGSALISAQKVNSSTKYTYALRVIDNTLLGAGVERGVTTDESVRYWGVNNLFNQLAVGHSLGGEVVQRSHNLYGVSVLDPSDQNGEDVASHELVGVRPGLFIQPARGCDQLPRLRPTSPAVGAGPGADDAELNIYNERLTYNGVEYNSLDDIGAQPVGTTGRDQDGDGHADNVDCDDRDAEVNLDGVADQDGDGVPDVNDCAPEDPRLAERCEDAIVVYSGGRAGCGAAPRPLGLLGVLLALVLTRRRESSISPL